MQSCFALHRIALNWILIIPILFRKHQHKHCFAWLFQLLSPSRREHPLIVVQLFFAQFLLTVRNVHCFLSLLCTYQYRPWQQNRGIFNHPVIFTTAKLKLLLSLRNKLFLHKEKFLYMTPICDQPLCPLGDTSSLSDIVSCAQHHRTCIQKI